MSAPRLEPKSWPREVAECVGFLAMGVGALAAWSGKLSLDKIGGGVENVSATVHSMATYDLGAVVVPALFILAGAVICGGSLGVLVRVIRKGRKSSLFYRLRWARVMRENAMIERDGEQVKIPRLRSVRTGHDIDTLSVRMLPSQSVADWQAKAGRLADDFHATHVRIVLDPQRPYTFVGLVVDRSRGGLRKELLPPSAPLALPRSAPRALGRVRGDLSTLRLEWARVWRIDDHGRPIRGSRRWDLRVMWGWQWATETL